VSALAFTPSLFTLQPTVNMQPDGAADLFTTVMN